MSRSAKVQDIDSLREFRSAMLTFAEKASTAIGEADGEVQRITIWLENEATTHWASEVRKRHAVVMKAKEDLRFKQIFKSPTGGKQSTIDEEKALAVAMRRFQEAEEKVVNVKKWIRQLHKESHQYRGSVQRLATTVSVDVPLAAARIARMIAALEGYVTLAAPNIAPDVAGSTDDAMGRGSGVPEIGGGSKRFRKSTPDARTKDAAPPAGPEMAEWTSGEFVAGDAEAIEKLPIDREVLDSAAMVIVGAGVQSARRIYLERSPGAFPGDGGWYVGPAEVNPPGEFFSMRIGDLLKARPHFYNLLTLPTGTLIVIDGAGVASILNSADEDVFVREP